MQKITIGKFRSKLQKLTLPVVQDLTKDIILDTPHLKDSKIAEFQYGLNPDKSDIGEYSFSKIGREYRLFKLELNPFAKGKVDLILTGATARGLEVISLGKSKYILESKDSKWEGLKEKYGDQIRLINEDEWKHLQRNKYAPQLIKAMRRLSGL